MRRILPLAFAAAALAFACKPSQAVITDAGETIACSSDSDCKAALDAGNCNDGVCALCAASSDCPTGETCSAGTCGVGGNGGSSSSGGSGSSSSSGGKGDGGLANGQCNSSCDCKATGAKGPACVSGLCAPAPATCARSNDCPCGDFCSAGTCQPQCTSNATCPAADPVCYLPQGQCGPCTNSGQCGSGQCVGGKCGGDGGVCNASHCCNNGDCPAATPACDTSTGACGPCTSSAYCSSGYVCNTATGACEPGDGGVSGCGPNGCSGGLVCVNDACITATCNPACSPPQTCGANNNCVCPANCGGICATGTTCNTSNCQCSTASSSGGLFGSSGGLGASGGLPGVSCPGATCTTAPCGGCPSGQTCNCVDGQACSSSDFACFAGYLGIPGCCQ